MRKIQSPSERWPGYIGVRDNTSYPDLIRFQDMLYDMAHVERKTASRVNGIILEYLFEVMEEWGIEGIEPSIEKFPSKPLDEVMDFINWWYQEVEAEIMGAQPKNE